jgi:hypothetical protein
MAIRVKVGDVTVEADSESDLLTVLKAVGLSAATTAGKATNGSRPAAPPNGAPQGKDKLANFPDKLRSEAQRSVFGALLAHPDGLRDAQLRDAAGLKTNTELAGVMAALSKHAKALGVPRDRVLRKSVTGRPPHRSYHYKLTPGLRQAIADRGGAESQE